MNWYKTSQTKEKHPEFPSIEKEVPGRTEEDAEYDYHENRLMAIHNVVQELKDSKPGDRQSWSVVPFGRLKKIWEDYMKMGFVRDEKGMESISRQMIENVHRLSANTLLMGHTAEDPSYYYEDAGIEQDDPRMDGDYFTDENGQWRLSDYGLDKLERLALQLEKTYKAEDQLQLVDRMLNIAHQRSDLAAMFVEGGTDSLNTLFGRPSDVEANKRGWYKTAQYSVEEYQARPIPSFTDRGDNITDTEKERKDLPDTPKLPKKKKKRKQPEEKMRQPFMRSLPYSSRQ